MSTTVTRLFLCLVVSLLLGSSARAFVIFLTFDSRVTGNEIAVTENFNALRNFDFSIDVDAVLAPGTVYNDPALNGVNYNIYGILAGTPSGFTAFNLMRTIGGSEFYTQGSSLSFEISAGADLSDGLQASELVNFFFNGRELDTGRFHPALLTLDNTGSGSLLNSNNLSVVPPAPRAVNVSFGEEYDVDLSYDASTLTLVAIPEPSALGWAAGLVGLGLALSRRRRP